MAASSSTDLSTARRLWAYALTKPLHLLWGLVAVAVVGASQAWLVVLIKPLAQAALGTTIDFVTLRSVVWSMFALGLIIAVAEFAYMFLLDYVAQTVILRLRDDLFGHLQRLSLGFFEDASTGALVSRATNDLSVVQARLNYELANLVRQPITVAIVLGHILLRSSWVLMLIAAVVAACMAPVISITSRLMKQHTARIQATLADLTGHLTESLSAVRVVQAFGASNHEIERFERVNADARRAMMRAVRVRSALRPLLHIIFLFGVLLVLVGGGALLRHGSAGVGDIVLVIGSVQVIATAFKELGRGRVALAETLAASERVFEVIDTPPDLVDEPGATDLGPLQGRLEFRSVGFHYRTSADVLSDINLTIEPGQLVALVGASGSGKTTLANLIPRLYDVTSGALLVDGQDVREVTRHSLRSQIGIVPQQTVLFRGTVRDNIAYGRPTASQAEIETAARAANAHDFVLALPEGYETQVGERAAKLSGGQAQRIAIARAILRDPRILILDEATSSLDSSSEALVQEALDRLMPGRTSVVIAHRLSTVRGADLVVVLEGGRIVEQGSPAALLANPKSLFSRFSYLQSHQAES